jgi:hypothetical protein
MMQAYMKAVKAKLAETNPERVEAFEKGAQNYAKKLVASFKDFEFVRLFSPHVLLWYNLTTFPTLQYTGETMNPDGMVALLNYRVGCSLNANILQ